MSEIIEKQIRDVINKIPDFHARCEQAFIDSLVYGKPVKILSDDELKDCTTHAPAPDGLIPARKKHES